MGKQRDIVLVRDRDGAATANVPHKIVCRGPDGFEWGYHGSGPADLALNILLCFTNVAAAHELHQDFKREIIAPMPYCGGTIKVSRIQAWLEKRQSKPSPS